MVNAEYLDIFLDESHEHLQAINDNLLKLEQAPNDLSTIGKIFRSAHTLKGMAASMGFEDLTHLTHNMETILDLIRSHKLEASSTVLDVVFMAVDELEAMIVDIASGGDGKCNVSEVITYLERIENGAIESETSATSSFDKAQEIKERILKVSEITSVAVLSLDAGNLQTDNKQQEVVQLQEEKNRESQSLTKGTNSESSQKVSKRNSNEVNKTIRVTIERFNVLMNLIDELIIDRDRLEQIESELQNPVLNETVERISRISGDLQEVILNMCMMPVEQVFNRFPRMIRSLSKDLDKKVNLTITGAKMELDRTIIDEIGDLLVHLLRNSIDHGIETPDKRISVGKSEEGTVKLKAYHRENHVFIEIEDDGAGIDRDKVLKKALANGIVTEEDAANMTEQQVFSLLFLSGFSTAEKITEVSGRGVGLDVVHNTLEALGGVVTVNSILGKGSVFLIQLPPSRSSMLY